MTPETGGYVPLDMPASHCPHCLLPLAGAPSLPHPPAAMRCPHCRLIIGAGRARAEASDDGDARSRGSAAGVLANAARRAHSEPGGVEEIGIALRKSAALVACPVERLRMLDYQQQSEADSAMPSLSAVLATFTTWKSARAAAGTELPTGVTARAAGGDEAAQVA